MTIWAPVGECLRLLQTSLERMRVHGLGARLRRSETGAFRVRPLGFGHTCEFADFRPADPNDPARYTDLRLLACTGQRYTRLFEDAANIRLHVVVDLTPTVVHAPTVDSNRRASLLLAGAMALVATACSSEVCLTVVGTQEIPVELEVLQAPRARLLRRPEEVLTQFWAPRRPVDAPAGPAFEQIARYVRAYSDPGAGLILISPMFIAELEQRTRLSASARRQRRLARAKCLSSVRGCFQAAFVLPRFGNDVVAPGALGPAQRRSLRDRELGIVTDEARRQGLRTEPVDWPATHELTVPGPVSSVVLDFLSKAGVRLGLLRGGK